MPHFKRLCFKTSPQMVITSRHYLVSMYEMKSQNSLSVLIKYHSSWFSFIFRVLDSRFRSFDRDPAAILGHRLDDDASSRKCRKVNFAKQQYNSSYFNSPLITRFKEKIPIVFMYFDCNIETFFGHRWICNRKCRNKI